MISFGQNLYQLTGRDEVTLFVDPFFRSTTLTIPAGINTSFVDIALPIDRCLFLAHFNINGDSSAGSTWSAFQLGLIGASGTVFQLVNFAGNTAAGVLGDNSTATGVGGNPAFNRSLMLLCPSGTSALRLSATRVTNTNPATATLFIASYLVPPGSIGRIG